ncbi:hypothetical protein MML48_7g00015649 [Holotrichia oblita]|uniref:Uncharacterized protein n=1 Tax=Holotrichia oblita TaxID=644536 RepID=A0ACB9SR55_HOLOL|nr:hypothetical protein MML48_7g00015649 [Holotrichia oblita]
MDESGLQLNNDPGKEIAVKGSKDVHVIKAQEIANPNKKIERRHFGNLLTNAWTRAATPSTGASGFCATGVYPLQPSAIPDHAYLSIAEGIENKQTDNSEPAESLPGPSTVSDWTPKKILGEISPIQTVQISNNPKRRKQCKRIQWLFQ